MAKKTPPHGGKREGAGRKVSPDGPAVVVAVSVPKSLADALDAKVKAQGVSKSAAVGEALRAWLNRKTR